MTTNTWHLPWVAVTIDGTQAELSPRDALVRAHEITDLAIDIPVEREATLRLLTSIAAMVLREGDPVAARDCRRFESLAVDAFGERYFDRFDLADPDRPFLQEWHYKPDPNDKAVRPLRQLHIHVPGSSSSPWCLRPEKRDPATPGVLAVLLAATWFHSKANNGAPPVGRQKQIAGAPAGGPRDTCFHLLGATLAETLLANIPIEWVTEDDTLPTWLDQDAQPSPFAVVANPQSLWRSTWTPNRPSVLWADSEPIGFLNGLTACPVPPLVPGNVKESAKALNFEDYAHLRYEVEKKSTPAVSKRVVAPEHLLTTEGIHHWYTQDLDEHFRAGMRGRLLPKSAVAAIALYNERSDTYGNRRVSEWTPLPLRYLSATGGDRDALLTLLTLATEIRRKFSSQLLRASDSKVGGSGSALASRAERDFYSAIDPVVLSALSGFDDPATVTAKCHDIGDAARRVFSAHTQTLMTPATAFKVEEARARFGTQTAACVARATKPAVCTIPVTND